MMKQIIVGIGILLTKNNQILLGFHKDTNQWRLPGGKLEFFESLKNCVIRELKEETNYDANDEIDFISITNLYNREDDLHNVILGAYVKSFSGNLVNNEKDKFLEWKWFPLSNFPVNIFRPSISIINTYLLGINKKSLVISEENMVNVESYVMKGIG